MYSPADALWRDRDFVRLWLAQGVSAFGARITREGLPIAAVLSLGASPAQVGLLAAISHGPALVVGLAAGGYVDRTSRRRIMMAADLVRAVVLATIPLAAFCHLLALPHLYLAAAIVGSASVLFEIADHAFLPTLLAKKDLARANASLSATESVAEIAGPALAGTLFQLFAAPFAIAFNAVTYLISALFLADVRKAEGTPEPEPHARWTDDLTRGFALAWRAPLVRPLLIGAVLQSLAGGVFSALYILFCVRVVGLQPAALGLTIAVGGVGALAGAAMSGRLARWLGVGPAIIAAFIGMGCAVLLIPLTPTGATLGMPVLMVSQFFGDAFAVAGMVQAATLRQTVLPAAVLGRVGAAFKAAAGGPAVLGALAGGVLAEHLGVRGAMWVAAGGILLAPLAMLPTPLSRTREAPEV